MNNSTETPDFSALVQGLFASQAKSGKLIEESRGLIDKMGRARRSLEKLGEAMSDENVAEAATKATKKRRSKKA